MSAAAVENSQDDGSKEKFSVWFWAVMLTLVIVFSAGFAEMFTQRGGDMTGIISKKLMGQEWVDGRVASHSARAEEQKFFNDTVLTWPHPICASPEQWRVMSPEAKKRWGDYWTHANAEAVQEARLHQQKDVYLYERLETTESCYVSSKKKLE